MNYLISFYFNIDPLSEVSINLVLTNGNTFTLNKPMQLQSVNEGQMISPMTDLTFSATQFIVNAMGTPAHSGSFKFIAEIAVAGDDIQGALNIQNGVNASYQFIGYSNQGAIGNGTFSIPLPQ